MTPEQMAALHAASFQRGWSVDELRTLLSKPTTLATTSAHGFALLQIIAPEAEVLTIVINPALRGQGHGRTLLRQAVLAASKRGVRHMFLEVDAMNIAALALYRSAGFTQTGQRKGYYAHADGIRSDAICLACAIPAGT